jgi:hypothetical protein
VDATAVSDYERIADVADRVTFFLTVREDCTDDLKWLAATLMTLTPDSARRRGLARSARLGLDGILRWLRATAVCCQLEVVGADSHDLFERLSVISWAWGELPLCDSEESQGPDKALFALAPVAGFEIT